MTTIVLKSRYQRITSKREVSCRQADGFGPALATGRLCIYEKPIVLLFAGNCALLHELWMLQAWILESGRQGSWRAVEEAASASRRTRTQSRRAEDFVALSNLEDAYGYYVDKCQWDQAADLFAKDGRLEIAGRGVYIGQDRVRAYLHHLPKFQYGQVFNHMQLQPVITVGPDGKSAKARWRAVIQAGVLHKSAQWGEGTYENEYVKENGVWKFKSAALLRDLLHRLR